MTPKLGRYHRDWGPLRRVRGSSHTLGMPHPGNAHWEDKTIRSGFENQWDFTLEELCILHVNYTLIKTNKKLERKLLWVPEGKDSVYLIQLKDEDYRLSFSNMEHAYIMQFKHVEIFLPLSPEIQFSQYFSKEQKWEGYFRHSWTQMTGYGVNKIGINLILI